MIADHNLACVFVCLFVFFEKPRSLLERETVLASRPLRTNDYFVVAAVFCAELTDK